MYLVIDEITSSVSLERAGIAPVIIIIIIIITIDHHYYSFVPLFSSPQPRCVHFAYFELRIAIKKNQQDTRMEKFLFFIQYFHVRNEMN